nr:MAG TPA: hypothetical protein [Caudoviricetes sp.]
MYFNICRYFVNCLKWCSLPRHLEGVVSVRS